MRMHVAVLLLTLVPMAPAKGEAAPAPAVQGEILDLACYVAHGQKGPDHAACARKCVQSGQPMGLLAADGVYVLFADHDDAAPFEQAKKYAGRRVEIRGPAVTRDGTRGLTVLSVRPL
jgi:hypothetical protein